MPGSSSLSSRLQNASVLNAMPALMASIAGVRYLLNYADGTFDRNTGAAWIDPRDPANGGTGAFSWAFVKNTTVAEGLAPPGAALGDFFQTSEALGATITNGQDDPAGGTLGQEISDDGPGLDQSESDTVTYPGGSAPLWISFWVKREVSAAQWMSIQVMIVGGVRAAVGVDLDTGEIAAISGSPTHLHARKHTVSSVDWFFVAFRYDGIASSGDMSVRIIPARGSVFPVDDASKAGDCTVYNIHVVDEDAEGVANPTPFAYDNVPRIFSDGAVLIEEERENLIDYSRDAGPSGALGNWTNGDAVYDQTGGQVGADGKPTTMQVICDAGEFGPVNGITSVAGDNAVSCYARRESEDEGNTYKHGVFSTPIAPAGTGEITMATADWRRDSFVGVEVTPAAMSWRVSGRTTDAGDATTPNFDLAWDLVQWEAGKFISSPIRAGGAATTRNKEELLIAQADIDPRFFTEGFRIDIWPTHGSGSNEHGTEFVFVGDTAFETVRLQTAGAVATRLLYRTLAGDTNWVSLPTFVAHDKITLVVEVGVQMEAFLNDVSAGTDSLVGATTWTPNDLYVGQTAAGGNQFNGVIGRVRAL